MEKREELQHLRDEINDLYQKTEDLNQKAYSLEDKVSSLVIQVILEENILAGSRWELRVSRQSIPYLEYYGASSDAVMLKIKELTKDNNNSNFNFEEGTYLQFDEDRMSIHFGDIKKVAHYISTLQLEIDPNPVKTSLGRLRKDLLALEMVCHQLQIPT